MNDHDWIHLTNCLCLQSQVLCWPSLRLSTCFNMSDELKAWQCGEFMSYFMGTYSNILPFLAISSPIYLSLSVINKVWYVYKKLIELGQGQCQRCKYSCSLSKGYYIQFKVTVKYYNTKFKVTVKYYNTKFKVTVKGYNLNLKVIVKCQRL